MEQRKEGAPPDLYPVRKFVEGFWRPGEASLRALILNSRDRLTSSGLTIRGNGLSGSGALVRCGKRILIDRQLFFAWLDGQQEQPRPCVEQVANAPQPTTTRPPRKRA